MHWRRVTVVDVILAFAAPLMAAWGVASALGWEQLDEMKVVAMSPLVTAGFWSTWALFLAHLLVNRGAQLTATTEQVSYRVGRIPGRTRAVGRSGLCISVDTHEDPIAEADAAGRSADRTVLRIHGTGGRITIDDLSRDAAFRVKRLLEPEAS